ncbi:MAG: DUF167 domain-containing protein [Candidatus Nealsonbacteria bacterium]|nr:MAG: DUF167 domain-containing protein [Candidatus Nealsonbacteria bacterium]
MLIKVKVFPSSKKEEIIKKSGDSFEVKVKEKPRRGEVNKKLVEVLAFYFKISKAKIKLIKGTKKRSKIFEIRN